MIHWRTLLTWALLIMAQELALKKNSSDKQVVIITGSGGIGKAVAKKFAQEGWIVVFIARNKKRLSEARKEITKFGKCFTYILNVTNEKKVKQVITTIYKKFKSIDAVVNGAGIVGPIGQFHTNSLSDWKNSLLINVVGTASVCHAVLPYMIKKRRGSIINFSGGGAVQPFPNFSAYAAAKAAVVRLTENLAREYGHYAIRINAVAPGAINTNFLKNMFIAGKKKVGAEYYKKMLQQKRSGGDSPNLAADLIFFLCSDLSFGLTGKLISAKWDPWKEFTQSMVERINKNSEYTLRRIDNHFFEEKK